MSELKNSSSLSSDPTNSGLAPGGQPLLTLENAGPVQMGFWIPNRSWATAKYLIPLRKHIDEQKAKGLLKPLTSTMKAFKDWVTANSVYRMGVNLMIEQANAYTASQPPEVLKEITMNGDAVWIPGYDGFFEVLNEIVTTSPAFNRTEMVGTPMNGFLAVAMGTDAGTALFHDSEFNKQFKTVLDSWNSFLNGPDSLDKLDINAPEKPGSWISDKAYAAGVWNEMVYDSSLPGYGFASWNAFFLRYFQPNARPFYGHAEVDVNIGCETTPWQYQDNLQFESRFWVKDMPYSLLDLFAGNSKFANMFVGGQLYQGFLSATHYHRWHAPIDGEIVCSWVQPGTYFAQRPGQGEEVGTWEGTESQSYLGHVAARAILIFKHRDEAIGYVALICIGMVEVSTCVIEQQYIVNDGATPVSIKRGTEIGHFEFGGSTHVMIFQKDKVKLKEWALDAVNGRTNNTPTHMGTVIASVNSPLPK